LDVDQLREQLRASIICQPDMWPVDIDDMAAMYESELAAMLDRLIPFREVTCRPRTTAWKSSASLAILNVHTLRLAGNLISSRHPG